MRFVRKSKNVKYVRTSFSENPPFESHSPKTSKMEQRPKLAETCEKQKHKPKYEILKRGNQCKLLIQGTTKKLLWMDERIMPGVAAWGRGSNKSEVSRVGVRRPRLRR